jgi:hypothetical protein
VVLPGVGVGKQGSYDLTPVIRVSVIDQYGRSVDRPDIIWYGNAGKEIGRGRSLDLRNLPIGFHTLRAVVRNSGQEGGSNVWIVERTRQNTFKAHRGAIKYPDPDCPPAG